MAKVEVHSIQIQKEGAKAKRRKAKKERKEGKILAVLGVVELFGVTLTPPP